MTFFKTAALAILTTCAAPVHALDCMGKADAAAKMADAGYEIEFVGDASNATLVIWVHQSAGWVSVIDTPEGQSCLVGTGKDWQLRGLGDPV